MAKMDSEGFEGLRQQRPDQETTAGWIRASPPGAVEGEMGSRKGVGRTATEGTVLDFFRSISNVAERLC